ncbi:pheromone alpha factor receptor [Lecanicillium sp. MT-2017a]|nr:pheromone alpha factor receptor [Lecanicillium sp. MT-2017a]
MADQTFNPYTQNISITAADATTTIQIPIPMINAFSDETVSIVMNYGAQMGACIAMFLVMLILTPTGKLTRSSSVLHLMGLLVNIIRMALTFPYFRSPLSHFYEYWTGDFSRVPAGDFRTSVTANTLSLLLTMIIQAALMNQAWTMVAFWPTATKYAACVLSLIIMLLTIGSRLAFTIVQNEAIISLQPPVHFYWGIHWTVIMNAISIFWFCAIFNVKLVMHLIINRGILPSRSMFTPMEVLIMTNGTLMIVPAIFAGLEWGKFTNFEAGSLTTISVIIILPLGTLTAQRISQAGSQSYVSGHSKRTSRRRWGLKSSSVTSASNDVSQTKQSTSVVSRSDTGTQIPRMDHIDLELSQIDGFRESSEVSHSLRDPNYSKVRGNDMV